MNNNVYLNNLKRLYDSLQNFDIEGSYLILRKEKEFRITLVHTNLANLNPSIYLLNEYEIFQIIYMLELLHKNVLTEMEIDFITKYTEKYLELNDLSKNDMDIDTNRLWNLGLPINLAYDNNYINTPSSNIIIRIVDNHIEKVESSNNRNPRLVLIKGDNPNFEPLDDDSDNAKYLKEAGFATFFLIIISILGTCLFVAFFIFKK